MKDLNNNINSVKNNQSENNQLIEQKKTKKSFFKKIFL